MAPLVQIREFKQEDYSALAQIIRETWNYDRFCSPKNAVRLAMAYLDGCLAEQTFIRVALTEDKPVGVIMAKDIAAHYCPFSLRLHQIGSVLGLLSTKEGRSSFRMFREVERIDRVLLGRCGPYEGELTFFAVKKTCRGMGVGTLLFREALEYFRMGDISSFYLYTDTSCNYGFYEHQGMQRRAEQPICMDIRGRSEEAVFYLYDFHV